MKLEKGETYIWTHSVGTDTLKTTFKVLEDYSKEGSDSRPPHYMCEFIKIRMNGKEVTESYLEKSFSGERTRGLPVEKIEEMDSLKKA